MGRNRDISFEESRSSSDRGRNHRPERVEWTVRKHGTPGPRTRALMSPPCSAPILEANVAPTMLPALPVVAAERPHLPASRAEMEARGWDSVDVVFVTGDAYVDHPAFAMGILEPRARGGRVPGRRSEPARLAERRAVAAVRPSPAVLRHQRRQHGQHDQPLHGQQEGPQRRCLLARRPDRPAARSRHDPLLPARPRGVPGRAGHRRGRRGVAPSPGALRLLERHRPPRHHARRQGRPGRLRHGRAPDRHDRQAARGRRDA